MGFTRALLIPQPSVKLLQASELGIYFLRGIGLALVDQILEDVEEILGVVMDDAVFCLVG